MRSRPRHARRRCISPISISDSGQATRSSSQRRPTPPPRMPSVFVDADRRTGNIDIAQIEAALTPRTRAISLVHYLGLPVDMDRVNAIAKKHDLFVVEDCALSLGSRYREIHTGLLGDVGCFS